MNKKILIPFVLFNLTITTIGFVNIGFSLKTANFMTQELGKYSENKQKITELKRKIDKYENIVLPILIKVKQGDK